MRAINHAFTGAIIGLTVGNPALALPAAFVSHYVCDAIPHFGAGKEDVSQPWFTKLLALDAAMCVLLVIVLAITQPRHWFAACISAFLATSPDLMWIPKYLKERRGIKSVNTSFMTRFHAWIQWFERPPGAITEVLWFAGSIAILVMLIRA